VPWKEYNCRVGGWSSELGGLKVPKYLYHGTYVGDGVKGLIKDGGSGRVAAVRAAAESMGGSLESFYFSFGKDDFHVIVDLPDNVTAAALALVIAATGRVSLDTTVLLSPEEIDAAVRKHPDYRAPGS
jgi:uncharacterized protein with GYD domain